MNSFLFRKAQSADVNAIVALVESAYRGDTSRIGWTTEADFLEGQRTDVEAVSSLISEPENYLLLCEQNQTMLGCAHLHKQNEIAHFGMFAVQPTLQSSGIGKAMLAEAERIAGHEWGCITMQMKVISIRHELIAWYQRRGYRKTGQYDNFPYGNEKFGVPKRDDLHFEILEKTLK